MDKEKWLLKKYGLCPAVKHRAAISRLLKDAILNPKQLNGSGEYLRILCFMLFYFGHVADAVLIWQAKNLKTEPGVVIDVGLLCGAGYHKTLDYLQDKPEFSDMKDYIIDCYESGETFNTDMMISDFKQYYASYSAANRTSQ